MSAIRRAPSGSDDAGPGGGAVRQHGRIIFTLLAIALALRVAAVFLAPMTKLVDDDHMYDEIARNLVAGRGYSLDQPTAMVPPLYPLFLAGVYALFGRSFVAVGIVQSIVDVVTALLVAVACRRLWRDPSVPAWALALYALYPPFLLSARMLMTETLFTLLLIASVLIVLSMLGSASSPARAAAAGALAGLGAQCRPTMLLLPFLLAAFVVVLRPLRRRRYAEAALIVVTAVTLQVPWTLRNYATFGTLVPGSTIGGWTFWMGTPPDPGRSPLNLHPGLAPERVLRAVDSMPPIAADRFLFREGIKNIRERPSAYAALAAKRVVRLWLNLGYDEAPSVRTIALAVVNALLLALAALGLIRLWRTGRTAAALLALVLGYFTAVHSLTHAQVRHSFPLYAPLIVLSAGGAAAAAEWLAFRRSARPAPAVARQ